MTESKANSAGNLDETVVKARTAAAIGDESRRLIVEGRPVDAAQLSRLAGQPWPKGLKRRLTASDN